MMVINFFITELFNVVVYTIYSWIFVFIVCLLYNGELFGYLLNSYENVFGDNQFLCLSFVEGLYYQLHFVLIVSFCFLVVLLFFNVFCWLLPSMFSWELNAVLNYFGIVVFFFFTSSAVCFNFFIYLMNILVKSIAINNFYVYHYSIDIRLGEYYYFMLQFFFVSAIFNVLLFVCGLILLDSTFVIYKYVSYFYALICFFLTVFFFPPDILLHIGIFLFFQFIYEVFVILIICASLIK